ncbi:oligosaccharide flippase family protein [Cupriavidus oxalaticus]|uniref:Flippase n=1 Tax=Cupriavidus oxalaticus TaxID=96344 RepID=A0A5P3VFB0_9BURK|nr:oligosaccharide flippase family protein [Cupriavidus oxalaticus]QEZ44073.1 flippase [Cupriavidus oxalaticus]
MRASHIFWNLLGLSLPLLIAALTVPHLLHALGTQRFGLLTLAWALIGYATALDFGVGRAATQRISALRAGTAEEQRRIPDVLGSAIRITLVTGGAGAVLVWLALACGAYTLLRAEDVPSMEIGWSMALLALALPLQALSAAYRGVNEAYLNFRGISVMRILLGAANFGVPYLIALFTPKLYWLVMSLLLSRALAAWAYRALAHRCLERAQANSVVTWSLDEARGLMRFGGWYTLSSVLNPLVASADRFYISSTISAAAAAIYVIPYEMAAQSLIVVGAITTVTFPYLSQRRVNDPAGAIRAFYLLLLLSLAGMAVVSTGFWLLGDTVLTLWLGSALPEQSHEVIRVLGLGLLPFTVGTMYVALLHASGDTALTAKLNVVEFPLFLLLAYVLIRRFGILGAAYAWVLRISIDAMLLAIIAETRRRAPALRLWARRTS